jgi:hypothetical protein
VGAIGLHGASDTNRTLFALRLGASANGEGVLGIPTNAESPKRLDHLVSQFLPHASPCNSSERGARLYAKQTDPQLEERSEVLAHVRDPGVKGQVVLGSFSMCQANRKTAGEPIVARCLKEKSLSEQPDPPFNCSHLDVTKSGIDELDVKYFTRQLRRASPYGETMISREAKPYRCLPECETKGSHNSGYRSQCREPRCD